MNVIVTRHLTKHYGRRVGIEALDLSVPEGVVYGFLGPNGSGKTTTIRILMGLLRPGGGEARILGLDCWRTSARVKAEVGYLPGDLRLYPWLTGNAALRIFGRARGRDLSKAGRELADYFEFEPDVRVRAMSRGMRQKLGLILALAHEPRLLILDEPTAALDPLMQDRLNLRLRDLASRGATVFFSSHTLSEVELLCDRVAILREGRLVADESLDDLRRRARRQVIVRWGTGVRQEELRTPGFLELHERNGCEWRCSLTGNASELVRWAAAQPIKDLSVGQPDLEQLFRGFYSREGAER